MKKLILPLLLLSNIAISNSAQAQSQSMFAVVGGFEYLFERVFHIESSPNPGYRIDYSRKSTLRDIAQYNINSELRNPNINSTFSFTNTDKDFEGVFKKDMGVCRGYSGLRRKFRFLSFFDYNNVSKIEVPSRENEKKFVKFYKKIVKDIRNYKFRVIPGFSNLKDFSSDPLLAPMLKWQVLYEWKDRNFSPGMGTGKLLKGAFVHSTYEEMMDVRDRIEKNKQLGHNTLMWLSQKKSSWIHALEAIDATTVQEDGSFKITFWNDKFINLDRAQSSLLVLADGRLIYNDTIVERELNAAGVTDENDGEIVYMSQKLKEFCSSSPEKCELK
ncbi:MAG: hypothetical protein ACOYL6_09715 [Bacteriovoracaceae bacterium]